MNAALATRLKARRTSRRTTSEGPVARALLIGGAMVFLAFFLLLPLVAVFSEAL